jgi:ABC-type enterochelin transport system ATPase subunit
MAGAPLVGGAPASRSLSGHGSGSAVGRIVATPLDAFTFRDVAPELGQVLENGERTILMVSHRLAFAAYAHQIVVLGEDGKVREEGSFDELIDTEGVFRDIYTVALDELVHKRDTKVVSAAPPS